MKGSLCIDCETHRALLFPLTDEAGVPRPCSHPGLMDQRPRWSCLGFLSAGACTEKHHEPRRLPARIAVRAAQGGGGSWGFLVTTSPEDIPGVQGSQEGPTGQLEKNVRLTQQKLNHRVIVGAPQGEQPAPLP